jgi:hypothetical protein
MEDRRENDDMGPVGIFAPIKTKPILAIRSGDIFVRQVEDEL